MRSIMRADFITTRALLRNVICALALACATQYDAPVRLRADTAYAQGLPDEAHLQRLREYIKKSWTTLSRSTRDLPRALPDPKMPRKPGERWLLYVAPDESRTRVQAELQGVLDAAAVGQIEIRTLPRDLLSIREHGLLYLPRPYVVPGGRFNEMYGWDSYFIQVGLLRDGELDLARDMVDNFVYEIAALRHDPQREPHVFSDRARSRHS